ncbi:MULTISPECIES: peptidase domain-containing ABC transporter [unclassified Treponema]|uniref:peptidase domain-containing ABC transporter n=1 Tax=unclassified Treponema TaxID=2638727 RepID=UPI0020A4C391|nr:MULTISPECIES: peptidase domain-containing ABC transporter [unclassified Treponema]UTC66127.1 peptidase domain-containing ABC transporter [Treponema sp. OMZ 789]UTC68856.1 peptidase domain-containing ABC transporter [Treponema sp. OMZ 790]UTC71584.1 peptidase domain-containing ABC transporter [Treponema sp. OMZ 791]
MKNIILQTNQADCGAACIANICRHYGKSIEIDKIREILTLNKNANSGLGIIHAAETLGFSCRGAVSDTKELPKNIPLPCIVHIARGNENLYLVVYRWDKKYVYLADPAMGYQKTDIEIFKKLWTGVFFIILPAPDFSAKNEKSRGLMRFLPILKSHKKICAEILAASIILSFLGIISAFYFRFLIDEVLSSNLNDSLTSFSIGFLGVIIFRSLLGLARNQLLMHISYKIDMALIYRYFEHVLHLPMRFFTQKKTGEIIARMNDTGTIRQVISATALTVVLDSLMLIFGSVFLISLGSNLLIAAIVPVIISSILVWFYAKPYQVKIRKRAVAEAEKHSCIVESLNGISTIKALCAESKALERAEFKIVNAIRKGINFGTFSNYQNSIQNFIGRCGTLAIYWLGSLNILNGSMSLGQLISFVILSGYFLDPLARLLTLQPQLQEAYVAAERLAEIFDEETEENLDNGKIETDGLSGKIDIKNLSFGYDLNFKNLNKINLSINAGERVAFVGASGSGKTSLAKLLMKFYSPQEGDIFIDNINLKDLKTASYRKQVGYVPQEILLFSGTIAENINWSSGNGDYRRMISAAEVSGASSFIEALPDRYNTMVGEHGTTLSGGERQRIAIARILLHNPSILILDEATSALDGILEEQVFNTLKEIASGRTFIIIAHRLSTIKDCDKIFVFDKGEIAESGTHADLLEKDGVYSRLWETQNKEEEVVA